AVSCPHHTELCKQESMAFIAPSVGPGAVGEAAWRTAVQPRSVPIWWSQQQRKQERLSCTPVHEQRTTFNAASPSAKSSTMTTSDHDDTMDNVVAAEVHTTPQGSLRPEVVAPTARADAGSVMGHGAPSRGSRPPPAASEEG
ncbi:unnamed protein product, partial [Ectocarpus fasciculatus]